MKNLEFLQKLKKKYKITEIITCILLPILIFLMVITTNNNITVLAYIFTILIIIDIIIGLFCGKKRKELNIQIYDVGVISQAIEDNKD